MKKHQGDPPTCIECRHRGGSYAVPYCHSDDCSKYDSVYGRRSVGCADARATGGPCGVAAKFFEPTPAPGWFSRNALPMFISGAISAWLVWSGMGWELFKFAHWMAGYGHLP